MRKNYHTFLHRQNEFGISNAKNMMCDKHAVIQRQQSSENGRRTFKENRLLLCAKERPIQIRQNDRNAFYKSTCYALKYSSSSIYSKFNAFNCELMRTNVKKDYNKRNLSCYKRTVVSLVTEPISLPTTEAFPNF
ncbi:hypothetical protein T12_7654 [Trichinella patagoniensis]|uniref:Uncharacterized protein n=1 Tax=Trichinella patagoniensis TaxID=990121 RepID=A0A0V0ZBX1_9BILA|nr:hypothetical protein T12_7654 [Trichinella patagoniensis]